MRLVPTGYGAMTDLWKRCEIWKFKLDPTKNWIEMPHGSRILYATEQYGDGVLYAQVYPDNALILRKITIVGTGMPFDPGASEPAGLIKLANGSLMFHVFVWPDNES
jgi:hypothetical protein